MKETYTTKRSGIELRLKAVEPLALHNILYRIGLAQTANQTEISAQIERKTMDGKQRTLEAINQLFGYCITQGIETPAPPDGIGELEAMGFPTSNPNVARLYWLRCIELQDQQEAGEIVGLIIALTFAPSVEEKQEFEDALDDD